MRLVAPLRHPISNGVQKRMLLCVWPASRLMRSAAEAPGSLGVSSLSPLILRRSPISIRPLPYLHLTLTVVVL